jgi:predicted CopG family antitoxin
MYKTIRITEETHELIGKHVKRKGESYGDIIERVFKEYDSLVKTKK